MSSEENSTGDAGHTQTSEEATTETEEETTKERDESKNKFNNTHDGTHKWTTKTHGITANSTENRNGESKITATGTRPRLTRAWTRDRLLDQATDLTNSAREALR